MIPHSYLMTTKIPVRLALLFALSCFGIPASIAQQPSSSGAPAANPGANAIQLWPSGAPLAQGDTPDDQPRLTIYLPERQTTHTGVVVLPGGGYTHLAVDKEGTKVAQFLNTLGVAAFVLEYRLGPKYHNPVELMDGQRAVRYVRAHAAEYHISPDLVGMLGFSAGGHLTSHVGTVGAPGDPSSTDPVERVSSRPNFMVLCYPVIEPLGPAAIGSFDFLLGRSADPALLQSLSTNFLVDANTPPTFLVLADDDKAVFPQNSVDFYLALKKAGVPAEMHIYQHGGHGFGLAPQDPVNSSWTQRLTDWLRGHGYLNP